MNAEVSSQGDSAILSRKRKRGVRSGGGKVAAGTLALLLAGTGLGALDVLSATAANAATSGVQTGSVIWPADTNLYANAVWSLSGAEGLVGGVGGGTPTVPIQMRNVANTLDRDLVNVGVSAHPTSPGIYSTVGLAVTNNSAASPAALARYGFANTVQVDWSPFTGPDKGKTFAVEIPQPAGFDLETCGMEVNPITFELVILNDCEPAKGSKYWILNPGPDGDPLTIADNSFRSLVTANVAGQPDPGVVSDITLDAAGNIYNLSSGGATAGSIIRTNGVTGATLDVGSYTYPVGHGSCPGGVGLAVRGGLIINTQSLPGTTSTCNVAGINPVTGIATAVPNTSFAYLNTPVNYGFNSAWDGAGIEGVVSVEGTVVDDVTGVGLASQTIALYRDNGNGTATFQRTTTTDASGIFATLLDSSTDTFYLRVVQPALVTSGQTKNGEVVSVAGSLTVGAGVSASTITAMNQRNGGIDPPVGVAGVTTIPVTADTAGMKDLVKFDANDSLGLGKADFRVRFAGSTGDRDRNSLLQTGALGVSNNGPQHLNIAGENASDLQLGASLGSYLVGVTDNSHASDDGVSLLVSGQPVALNDQLLARAQNYQLRATSTGAQAANAQVTGWVTAPTAADPPGAWGGNGGLITSGSGAVADLTLTAPDAVGNAATVRVNTGLTAAADPHNLNGIYAPAAGSALSSTLPWTTAGEVEDYRVAVAGAVVRLAATSTVNGTYSFSLTNVSATAPSATTSSIVTSGTSQRIATRSHAVTTLGSNVAVTISSAPSGTILKSAEVVNSRTGAAIGAATVAGNVVTIPGSMLTLGSDVMLSLTYSEVPNAVASTFGMAPASATADGTSEIVATVTVIGATSGNPLPGQTVTVSKQNAGDPVTISAVTDNGDGTYTARLKSSTQGSYPIIARVTVSGTPTQVGATTNAAFVAGAPSASNSSWQITPVGPQMVGSDYTASVTVRDASGNPVGAGQTVDFTIPAGVNGAVSTQTVPAVTNSSGVASLTLTSTAAATYAISASIGGDPIGGSAATGTKSIVFTAGAFDLASSGFGVSLGSRVADGTAAHTATATARDAFSNPISGTAVSFNVPAGMSATVASGTWVSGGSSGTIVVQTGADGKASLSLVSTSAASYSVNATVASNALPGAPANVLFVAGPANASASTWQITPSGSLAAGGTFTAKVTVRDALGNPVGAGVDVTYTVPAGVNGETTPTPVVVTSDSSGEASLALTATTAGSYAIAAAIGADPIGGTLVTGTKDIVFVAAAADAAASTLTASAGTVEANNTATHSASVVVRDGYNNVAPNIDVTFSLESGVNATVSAGTEISNSGGTVVVRSDSVGVASLQLTSGTQGVYDVAASIAGSPVGGSPKTVEFIAGAPSAANSVWAISPAGPLAAGGTYTASATVRDGSNNALGAGVSVSFTLPAEITGGPGTVTTLTNGAGVATLDLTSTTAGTFEVSAAIGGDPLGGSAATGTKEIVFTAGGADPSTSTITASKSPIDADGIDASTITVQLRDEFGNPLESSSDDVEILTDRGSLTVTSASTGGRFTADLTGVASDDGLATLRFTVNGANGTAVTTVNIVDSVPPNAPVVDPSDGTQVTVTTEPGFTVEIRNSLGEVVCSATANGVGVATCVPTSPLPDGNYSAVAIDLAGNSSPPTPFAVDGTAPVTPVVEPSNGSSVSGTAEPGSRVEVRDAGGAVLCTATAAPDGTFSCTIDPAAADGDVLEVVAIDAAGNESSPGASVTVDSSAPVTPVVEPSNGSSVSGTAEPGSLVEVRDADGAVLCTATAAPDGTFSCLIDPAAADGDVLEVVAIDAAGNESSPGASVTVDSSAPVTPVVEPSNGASVSGTAEPGSLVEVRDADGAVLCTATAAPDGTFSCTIDPAAADGDVLEVVAIDAAGNESSPGASVTVDSSAPVTPVVEPSNGSSVSGTAEPGSLVEVRDADGAVLCTATAAPDATFSCTIDPAAADGDVLEVVAIDAAGNESSPGASVTVDSSAPVTPVVEPSNGASVSGTAEPGSLVEVRDADGAVLCTATAAPDGTFSCLIDPAAADGDVLEVVAIDAAGNESSPGASVTVDSSAPAAPVIEPTNGSVVSGTAEPGSRVDVLDADDNILCSVVAGADGSFSCVPDPTPKNGDVIRAVATDAAGNSGPFGSVTDDAVAPEEPEAERTQGKQIKGTAEPGSTIEVTDEDGDALCVTTADADGDYVCMLEPAAKDGELLVLTATDPSGNVSKVKVVRVGGAEIALALSELKAGDVLEIVGTGFLPEESVSSRVESDPIALGTKKASADGEVAFTFTVPEGFELGAHTAYLVGPESGELSGVFTVEQSPTTTPLETPTTPRKIAYTGADSSMLLGVSAALIALAGATIVLVVSRRRRARSQEAATGSGGAE